MIDIAYVRKLALSLEDAVELPHFEKISFRVKNKIFAIIDENNMRACLMLSPIEQSLFATAGNTIIYPVPNSWGKKGATYFDLKKVRKDIFKDALKMAYFKVKN